ncbi:MAG: hypothetical protein JW829_16935 [Pirellulales bacterium]|nr:hypothetical protein [Pirellulales bacterium]
MIADKPHMNAEIGGGRDAVLPSLFFYCSFFLYIFFYLDSTLIYYDHFTFWRLPPYVPGSGGFDHLPGFPGKTAVCVAGVLLYCFYFSWAGALIVTMVAGLLSWGAGRFLDVMSNGRLRALRFMPAVVVLLQYSRYDHYMMENISIAFCLLLLYLYIRVSILREALRFILFLFLSAVIYYAAVYAYLLFLTLCAIYELLHKRAWFVGSGMLVSVLLIPIAISSLFFDISLAEVYLCIFPTDPATMPYDPLAIYFHGPVLYYFLYAFFPFAGFVSVYWRYKGDRIMNRFMSYYNADNYKSRNKKGRKSKSSKNKKGEVKARQHASRSHGMLNMAILLIIVFGAVLFSTDYQRKHYLRVRCYSQLGMWDDVLREARKLDAGYFGLSYSHDVNRALYHSGRLLDEMFAYPQPIGWQLYEVDPSSHTLNPSEKVARNSDLSETLYELGRVNEAENFAWDALAGLKYHPKVLMQLAKINIVKRQPDTARTLLRILSEDFLHRDQAQNLLKQLEADPYFIENEEIQRIRSLMPDKDSIDKCSLPELLDQNKHNRMAFEYLMASYLRNREVLDIVNNIGRLSDFNYTAIPRACEEALVIYINLTGEMPDLHGYEISQESLDRFQRFLNVLNKYDDKQTALFEVAEKFGDTYFFYNIYGFSGSQLKM